MTDPALLSKFAALPAHLQAEVADFIDFLGQKMARSGNPQPFLDPEKAAPATPPGSTPRQIEVEELGPLTSSGNPRIPLKFGAGKHLITYIADDFDAPMEEFEEYM